MNTLYVLQYNPIGINAISNSNHVSALEAMGKVRNIDPNKGFNMSVSETKP